MSPHTKRATLLVVALLALGLPSQAASAAPVPASAHLGPIVTGSGGGANARATNAKAIAAALLKHKQRLAQAAAGKTPGKAKSTNADKGTLPAVDRDPYQYRVTLACGSRQAASPDAEDDGRCTQALTECLRRTPPSDEVMYFIWRMLPGKTGWILMGDTCGTAKLQLSP